MIKNAETGFTFNKDIRLDKPIIEYFQKEQYVEILGHRLDGTFESFKAFCEYIEAGDKRSIEAFLKKMGI